MAEVAAGAGIALAAEQVISTTAQVGTAGYILTKPTLPLKATFTRIAIADDDDLNQRSLTRSHHSVTIIDKKAYIFGGSTSDGQVATNDIHIINLAPGKDHEPEYQLIPALPSSSSTSAVPAARTQHAACAFDSQIAIYGGASASDLPINDSSSIWLYSPSNKTWSQLSSSSSSTSETAPGPRVGARLFAQDDAKALYLYGGTTHDGRVSSDLWRFDTTTQEWTALPNPPALAAPTNAAVVENNMYLISSEEDAMSSSLHIFPLSSSTSPGKHVAVKSTDSEQPKWTTLTFPTNPLAPGPRARHSGALLPISTGYGRNYLVYLLGVRDTPSTIDPSSVSADSPIATVHNEHANPDPAPTQWSDTWTLQLPSSSAIPRVSSPSNTNSTTTESNKGVNMSTVTDAIKPAHLKDAIRSGVGADSGTWSWAEAVLTLPPDDPVQPNFSSKVGGVAEKVGEKVRNLVGAGGKAPDNTGVEEDAETDTVKEEVQARKVDESVTEGKLHPGPRSCFGADVLSGSGSAKVIFWGGLDAKGERVGDGWIVGFE